MCLEESCVITCCNASPRGKTRATSTIHTGTHLLLSYDDTISFTPAEEHTTNTPVIDSANIVSCAQSTQRCLIHNYKSKSGGQSKSVEYCDCICNTVSLSTTEEFSYISPSFKHCQYTVHCQRSKHK